MKPSILIIEDDQDVQRGWSMVLRHRGFSVLSARDGSRGLQMIEEEAPDLVLLDLGLPGLHGLDVMEAVEQMPGRPPVVVISAAASVQTGLKAHHLGASAVLEKPVDPEQLVPLVREVLRQDRH